jgi:hypothetical protein
MIFFLSVAIAAMGIVVGYQLGRMMYEVRA